MTGHIWLIGMMGAGKTTVGRDLAGRLGMPFVDLDDEVRSDAGVGIPELWEDEGESGFRRRETAVLHAAASGPAAVIAAGGGAVLDHGNVATMQRSGFVIWLDVAPEILIERIVTGSSGRPLLAGTDPPGRIHAITAERRARYQAAAGLVITALDRDQILDTIEAVWNASS